MALFGALALFLLIGGGSVMYATGRLGHMASHGSPAAARAARTAQRQAKSGKTALSGKASEIWAEAHSADWLETRRAKRARVAARTPVSQKAATAARITGRGAASTGRGIRRAGAAARRRAGQIRHRVLVPQGAIPAKPKDGPSIPYPTQDESPPSNVKPIRPVAAAQSAPTAPKETPEMSTPSTGAGADMFSAAQQITSQARAGGIRAKQRAIQTLQEGMEYIAGQISSLATHMSEPDQHYAPTIWEPLAKGSAQAKGAASSFGESSAALSSLIGMNVGELADSPVQAPNHKELNAAS
jgi:hypothetical protein